MADLTVVVRKHEGTGFYSAEIISHGVTIGATAITSIEIEEFGDRFTCYKLMRKIGKTSHMMVALYNVELDVKCDGKVIE